MIVTLEGTACTAKSLITRGVTIKATGAACDPPAAVPTIDRVALPDVAPAAAVKVSVEDPPADTFAGLKLPVTPLRSPLVASEMLCDTPDVTTVDTCTVKLDPGERVTPGGNAAIEKSLGAGAMTVRFTLAVCAPLVATPVIVAIVAPSAADVLALRVSVADAPAVTLLGLKLPVTPEGRPLIESAMLCAAPAVTAVATVMIALDPCVIDLAVGTAAMAKSFGTGEITPTPRFAVCAPLTAVPVIVALVVTLAAFADAKSVSVDDCPAVTLVGLKLPVIPAGRPASERDMVCATPDVTEVDTITVRLDPGAIATAVGDTASEKSFRPRTTIGKRAAMALAAEKSIV